METEEKGHAPQSLYLPDQGRVDVVHETGEKHRPVTVSCQLRRHHTPVVPRWSERELLLLSIHGLGLHSLQVAERDTRVAKDRQQRVNRHCRLRLKLNPLVCLARVQPQAAFYLQVGIKWFVIFVEPGAKYDIVSFKLDAVTKLHGVVHKRFGLGPVYGDVPGMEHFPKVGNTGTPKATIGPEDATSDVSQDWWVSQYWG